MSPASQELPISLTDAVLSKQREEATVNGRRNRSGSGASARRSSDGSRKDAGVSRARSGSDASTMQRERRGSNATPTSQRRTSFTSPTPEKRGVGGVSQASAPAPEPTPRSQPVEPAPQGLYDHAEEDTDVFLDDEESDEQDANTHSPLSNARVGATTAAGAAAGAAVGATASAAAAKAPATAAADPAPVRKPKRAEGSRKPAEKSGSTHDSALLFSQAKERSERMAKLKLADVQMTTEELREDIGVAREAMHLFLNSRMFEAYDLVTVRSEQRLYYAVAYALLSTIKAIMTFEHQDLATAISHCKDALHIASLLRKKTSAISSFGRFVRGAGPSVTWVATMTPMEQHAELVHAECTLLRSVLGIIYSGDLFGFLNEALHLRASYGAYGSLLKFVQWEEANGAKPGVTASDRDFRSGVFLGSGCINMLLGLLPSKVLKIMDVFGYGGDVNEGLNLLARAGEWSTDPAVKEPGVSREEEGVRRCICDMTILVYHLVVSTFVPVSNVDIPYAEKVLNYHLERYPEGVFFLYFHGRLYSTLAMPEPAVECFREARDIQEEYIQLKHICDWDLALCALSLGRWKDAYTEFSVLAEENNWSKAVYNYGRAAALYQTGDPAAADEAAEIFARVPSLMQKIAGKSIPLEKFVARKARKMIDRGSLFLPAMEFAYVCHCYSTSSNTALTDTLLPIVEQALKTLEADDAAPLDDVCLAHFLRGVIMRNIAYPEPHARFQASKHRIPVKEAAQESERSLRYVAEHGAASPYDHYLLYFAHYELGRLYIGQDRIEDGKRELDMVISTKNLGDQPRKGKYSMQNMAVLRSNGILELL